MTTKTIPAQTIKTCDCCGVTMDGRNSSQGGLLRLRQHALDMQGEPYADASVELDLCNRCLQKIGKAIDEAIKEVKP